MDIEEFVSTSLKQILLGIEKSKECEVIGHMIAPHDNHGFHEFHPDSGVSNNKRLMATTVKFDIAVTVEESASSSSKGTIAVSVFGVGGERGKADTHSSMSRIQFAVPIFFLGKK